MSDMLNSIERARLLRELGYLNQRLNRIESMLNGQQYINVAKIGDALITNAKIGSLAASKITSGQIDSATDINIGSVAGGNYIKHDGGDVNIKMFKNSVPETLIGMLSGTPVIKVGLSGINAETNTDPNNFVLYVDQATDYVLIKEKAKGSTSVSSGGSGTNILHGLGYVPFCLVFAEISSGVYKKLFSHPIDSSGYWFEVNSTNLILLNTSGSTKTYYYYIFYDKTA